MKSLARQEDKAELLRRLKSVRPDSPRRWGRMSAHQMVCHVSDCYRMAMGEKPVSPALGLLAGALSRWIALYAPVPWPAGIRTRPEIDQQEGGTRPAEFTADVAELEALLELVTAPTRPFSGRPHPIFGRMTDADWLRWGYLHMDHHLRQFGA